jgi:A/G-specific adenine glycosylase
VLSSVRRRLLAWYRHHRRDLPWRSDPTPYAVWVSEIMLQQTTVTAATPFFERWMERFPTLRDLAAADEEDVLRLWAGLGYYNRARNLHRAAMQIVAECDGEIPRTVSDLMELPGIGRYTAGAIASIAFGERVPVVDANVARVLARFFAVREEVSTADGQRVLWDHAEDLAQTNNPGDLNQALMELGALLCTPTSPRCDSCPIQPLCRAAQRGDMDRYPVLRERPEAVEVTEVGAAVERKGRFLILRRPKSGRMAGMWEFPHGPLRGDEPAETVAPMVKSLTGLDIHIDEPLRTIEYTFTHHQITLHVWRARATGGRVHRRSHDAHRWVALRDLLSRPMATAQRRIVEALMESAGGRQLDLLELTEESEESASI